MGVWAVYDISTGLYWGGIMKGMVGSGPDVRLFDSEQEAYDVIDDEEELMDCTVIRAD